MSGSGAVEFDCVECGMHIVFIIGELAPTPRLCAECIALPGWFTDPVLRKILDPDGMAKPVALPIDGGKP